MLINPKADNNKIMFNLINNQSKTDQNTKLLFLNCFISKDFFFNDKLHAGKLPDN